jgi:hypothetical protein
VITWLKAFLFDATAFTGLVRGLIQALGVIQAAGMLDIDGVPRWAGAVAVFLGGFIRAGEKNVPPTERGQ